MENPTAQIQHWDDWNSKYRQPELIDEPSMRRMHEVLTALKRLKVQRGTLLEVGCGTGWLSRKLAEFGRVTAVDLGKEIIESAKQQYPDIDFRSGDIHTIDLPAHSFDVIVTLETFSHVGDQSAFVTRLSDLLRCGGVLVLTTQNKYVFDRRAEIRPAVGYTRKWVDMKSLKQLLHAEFVIQEATTLEPEGHMGFLRVVNSRKINRICNAVVGEPRAKQLKEWLGFGQTIFVVARKR
jgi:2-polyprenyl-3-methyl-5-hydroxy-6-metoxy-1,4-benzoquinol methylase